MNLDLTYEFRPHVVVAYRRRPTLHVVLTNAQTFRLARSAVYHAAAVLEELSDGYLWTVKIGTPEDRRKALAGYDGPVLVCECSIEIVLVRDDDQEFDAACSTILASIGALEGR
jgi:hypothetical protein